MKTKRARLDPTGKAQPLTRLVSHVDPGVCIRHDGMQKDLQLEDTETRERIDCAPDKIALATLPLPTREIREVSLTKDERDFICGALVRHAMFNPTDKELVIALRNKIQGV